MSTKSVTPARGETLRRQYKAGFAFGYLNRNPEPPKPTGNAERGAFLEGWRVGRLEAQADAERIAAFHASRVAI
jgi:hypothetical protein